TTTNYTLDNGNDTTINLLVNSGDSIVLDFLGGGAWLSEVSFELLNPSNVSVYSSGTSPFVGVHYADTAFCPSCISPNTLTASNITSTSADLNWFDPNSATEWEVEYGTTG